MNTHAALSVPRPHVIEEAAQWLVEFRLDQPDGAQRRAFDAWLRSSPENIQAYLQLLGLWEHGAQLDENKQPSAAALIERARADADNVVALGAAPALAAGSRRARVSGKVWRLAAALAVAAIGAALWMAGLQDPVYHTGIGEQRTIALADGSTLELNALSRVRVRYSAVRRDIDLLAGQALFTVAHEAERPFVVHSSDAQVRAVGTQFDVYRRGDATTVTVVEGRVSVAPRVRMQQGDGPVREVLLSAGEQVDVAAGAAAVSAPAPANLRAAMAWTQRRLIFSAAPLAEVAEEFNRYNARKLVIAAGVPEDFQINGVFSSTDPQALLRFLREQPGISVTSKDGEFIIGGW